MDKPGFVALTELGFVDVRRVINQHQCPCCRQWKRGMTLFCDVCKAALPAFALGWDFHMRYDVLRAYFTRAARILGRQSVMVHPLPGIGEEYADEDEAALRQACTKRRRARE